MSQRTDPHLRPAVFLDRDGTIMEEVHYCADPSLVRLIPGTRQALARLKGAGYLCVIITNQSGIGRGLITLEAYEAVHAELLAQLGPGLIDATYFCPDAPPTESLRRKPATGMVEEAVAALKIDLTRSWFVGDKQADVECGKRSGTRTILVQTGYGNREIETNPDFLAKDVVAAAEIILENKDAKE